MSEKVKKRARVKYPCPFCLSDHNSSASISFCLKNPDREANRKRRSELNRASYEKSGARERLIAAADNDVTRLKRSINTKKMWEENRLPSTAGENNGMYGKKHTLQARIKISRANAAAQKRIRPIEIAARINKDLERENIAVPMHSDASNFFNQKMDRDGWVEVESHSNGFDDEFDPFH